MFLGSERMHDGSFQAIGQREDLMMRDPASRAAQLGDTAIAVEQRGEPLAGCGVATAWLGSRPAAFGVGASAAG
jgi:hypothetical protein